MAKKARKKRSTSVKKRASGKKLPQTYDFMPVFLTAVGEKKNYNLHQYTLYHISTIEYNVTEKRYQARIGFSGDEGYVFFNSYHEDFQDAERTINFVKEGKSTGKLYNIFAETLSSHTSPTLGDTTEVLSLIYSFVNG